MFTSVPGSDPKNVENFMGGGEYLCKTLYASMYIVCLFFKQPPLVLHVASTY